MKYYYGEFIIITVEWNIISYYLSDYYYYYFILYARSSNIEETFPTINNTIRQTQYIIFQVSKARLSSRLQLLYYFCFDDSMFRYLI